MNIDEHCLEDEPLFNLNPTCWNISLKPVQFKPGVPNKVTKKCMAISIRLSKQEIVAWTIVLSLKISYTNACSQDCQVKS